MEMSGFESTRTRDRDRVPEEPNSITPPPPPVVRYRECLKNHAASMGGHVTDGCGEFMPGGHEGTLEGLKCAACDCHRSFHRREAEGEVLPPSGNSTAPYHPYNSHLAARRSTTSGFVTHRPLAPLGAAVRPVMMTFGAAADSSSEELNLIHANNPHTSKKRFRTKFTQDQKGRMQEFAERVGWKIEKQNESQVQQFCADVGIKRQVFKVWMHNCKQASKRKQL